MQQSETMSLQNITISADNYNTSSILWSFWPIAEIFESHGRKTGRDREGSVKIEKFYRESELLRGSSDVQDTILQVTMLMGFRAIKMFSRYIGQKKYTELQGMLYDGALLLFSHV